MNHVKEEQAKGNMEAAVRGGVGMRMGRRRRCLVGCSGRGAAVQAARRWAVLANGGSHHAAHALTSLDPSLAAPGCLPLPLAPPPLCASLDVLSAPPSLPPPPARSWSTSST